MTESPSFTPITICAAAASRRLFRHRKPLETVVGDDCLSLMLDLDACPVNPVHLRLRACDTVFGLEIESTTLAALFEKHSGQPVETVFCDDAALQAEIALCTFLELTESVFCENIELLEVTDGPLLGGVNLGGQLSLDKNSAFRVSLPESILSVVCNVFDAWPTTPLVLAVPVACPVILDDLYISPRVLIEIQSGDFLPLRSWQRNQPIVRLRLPYGNTATGKMEANQMTILQSTGDRLMSDSEPAIPDDQPVANVFVEMGHIQVPLDELQLIAPGYVLDLQLPLDGPITVTANGRAFAKGTLVDVAGTVGVRIDELLIDV